MRRRLRDITSRVSGALPVALGQGTEQEPEQVAEEAGAPVGETGQVPAVTETSPDLPETAPAAAAEVPVPDAACAAALDLARSVAVEAGGSAVGEHLGVEADDERVVTHSFATTDPAYVGWRWAVTVARADGSDEVTVDEVVLLPGGGALLAPAWVPWSERVTPEDLAPGDLLPPRPDDPRIVPSYTDVDGELAAATFWELGLDRPRVLSAEGRLDAAERWYDGDRGPSSAMARHAPGRCLDCAFRVPLGGSLGAAFGVCANAFSPDDAKVVSLDHGCGAHSETTVELTHSAAGALVVEHEELELVPVAPVAQAVEGPEDETPDGHAS
ncbi:MAG: DUF3027 domain-containing protein [Mycobacteriales bacterium]